MHAGSELRYDRTEPAHHRALVRRHDVESREEMGSDHSDKNEALKYAPDALQRRLTIGCMPLYVQDGVDITNTVAAVAFRLCPRAS